MPERQAPVQGSDGHVNDPVRAALLEEWIRWRKSNRWLDGALASGTPERWRLAFADLLDQVDVVPRSEAEALADALEFIAGTPAAYKTCPCNGCKVLREYRARHPKETP